MFGGSPPAISSPRRQRPPLSVLQRGERDAHPVGKQFLISSKCVPDESSQRCYLLLCSRGSEKFGFKSEKIV